MKTEAQKIADKAWREANKEKKREYDRAYRLANREKKLAQNKRYKENNKDKVEESNRLYRIRNKDRFNKAGKEYYNKLKNGKITLYYLPEEHYIGVTNCMTVRMRGHKSLRTNRIIDGVEVVATFDTRAEALHYERLLHSIGYRGADFVKD